MKMHVVLALTTLVLLVGASGHDSDTLRKQYGDPIGEVFHVADDVIMTTSVDSHKNICALRIEHQSHGRRLTDAELKRVLDKVAPESERGEYVIGTFLNLQCPPDNDCSGVR